jgi:glycosyltransferase involved in cell wall biosynthesis
MKASAGRVLMLLENHFPVDVRPRNESGLLISAGYQVTIIALAKKGEPFTEVINQVRVYRLPERTFFQKTRLAGGGWATKILSSVKAILGYGLEYLYLTVGCFLLSIYVALKHGFDVIHAHNPPDMLFLVALPYKLFGKKFVFDHHDLSPELYRSRYGRAGGLIPGILQSIEKCSLKLADVVIATNESYKQIEIARGGIDPSRVFVVRNGPGPDKMRISPPSARLRAMGKVVLCYIGVLNPQDGVDYLLRSLRCLVYDLSRSDFYCVIMGAGDSLSDLRQMATDLKLDDHVELTGFTKEEELLQNLSAADICVDPDPSSPLNDVSTWIKIIEYMAYAKPIVAFDLKETRVSAQGAALYATANDELGFARAIAWLMDNPEARERMGRLGRERVETTLAWSVVGKNLLTAYRRLGRTYQDNDRKVQ